MYWDCVRCRVRALPWLHEPLYHYRETRLILASYRLELKPKSTPSINVAHCRISPNFSILDEEMQLDCRIDST
jgi:hypothetical protein